MDNRQVLDSGLAQLLRLIRRNTVALDAPVPEERFQGERPTDPSIQRGCLPRPSIPDGKSPTQSDANYATADGSLPLYSPRASSMHTLPKPHFHNNWFMAISLDNPFAIQFPTGREDITKKRWLIIPPRVIHSQLIFSDKHPHDSVNLMEISLGQAQVTIRYKGVKENLFHYLSPEEIQLLTQRLACTPVGLAERLHHCALHADNELARDQSNGWLRLFLAALLDLLRTHTPTNESAGERVRRLVDCALERNYASAGLRLSDIAREVGVSASYLGRIYRTVTGRTPHQALVELRLEKAQALLADGRFSVKEVAHLTGWGSQSHFSDMFSKRFRVPPSQVVGSLGAE